MSEELKRESMNNEELLKFLRDQSACDAAVEWVKRTGYGSRRAWDRCPDPSWLAWYWANRVKPSEHAFKRLARVTADAVLAMVPRDRIPEDVREAFDMMFVRRRIPKSKAAAIYNYNRPMKGERVNSSLWWMSAAVVYWIKYPYLHRLRLVWRYAGNVLDPLVRVGDDEYTDPPFPGKPGLEVIRRGLDFPG